MKEEQERKNLLLTSKLDVLGVSSSNQIVLYNDGDGVTLGTSLNDDLKPQIDITVDEKTTSKNLPNGINIIKYLNTFIINSWARVIELLSSMISF